MISGLMKTRKIARRALFRRVDDEQLDRFADLRRCETDAWRRVHRLGHVVDELSHLVRDDVDADAFFAKTRVWVVEDRADHVRCFPV